MSPSKYETATAAPNLERAISFEPGKNSTSPRLVLNRELIPVRIFLAVGDKEPTQVAELTLDQVEAMFAAIERRTVQ